MNSCKTCDKQSQRENIYFTHEEAKGLFGKNVESLIIQSSVQEGTLGTIVIAMQYDRN